MKFSIEDYEKITSIIQNIFISVGLIITGIWAYYTYFINENKENKFSPDIYIEHELLQSKLNKEIYLQVYLIIKNTSVQDLEFNLQPASATFYKNNTISYSKSYNNSIIIHPSQTMKIPFIFSVKEVGLYFIRVSLPLSKIHQKYLIDIGKDKHEIENYSFEASKFIYIEGKN